eukprot:683672-Prorocentrum_minimum.AAC.1
MSEDFELSFTVSLPTTTSHRYDMILRSALSIMCPSTHTRFVARWELAFADRIATPAAAHGRGQGAEMICEERIHRRLR